MIKETRKDALCSFIELQSTQDCVDCERVTELVLWFQWEMRPGDMQRSLKLQLEIQDIRSLEVPAFLGTSQTLPCSHSTRCTAPEGKKGGAGFGFGLLCALLVAWHSLGWSDLRHAGL